MSDDRAAPSPNAPQPEKRKTWKRNTGPAIEAKTIKVDFDEVKRLATLGLSVRVIASILEINERTLFAKLAKNKEAAAAIREGRKAVRQRLRVELMKQAFGGNTRVLLRLAEMEGMLSPAGLALQGPDGGPIGHEHTVAGADVFREIGQLMSELQAVARDRPEPAPPAQLAGEGQAEADST